VLDAINLNDGESCPGADTCREKKGPGNLWKYPETPEDEICKGCKLYRTKPERMPEHLARHAETATTLAELQRSGASFSYPHALQAAEWASLSGLTRGRERAETMRQERDRKDQKTRKQRNGRSSN